MKNRSSKILIMAILIMLLATGLALGAGKQEVELTADELVIDDLKGKVVATGNVELKQGKMSLQADKLVGNQALEEVIASGSVKITRNSTTMTGKELKLDNKSNTGVLLGNPKLKRETMVMTGNKFNFDFSAEELVIPKNAHIEDDSQDLIADANSLKYDQQKEEVVLTGDVKARRGSRRMNAERVVIDLRTNKMIAQGRTKFIVPNTQGEENEE